MFLPLIGILFAVIGASLAIGSGSYYLLPIDIAAALICGWLLIREVS